MGVILIFRNTIGGTYDDAGVKQGAKHIQARYETLEEAMAQIAHQGVDHYRGIVDEESGQSLWLPPNGPELPAIEG